MAKSDWFNLLLKNGYFPAELPPPFHTHDLARYRNIVTKNWSISSSAYPDTIYENYSIPRATRYRRNLAIINPIAQVPLCHLISDNWTIIRRHLRQKLYSAEALEITGNQDRAIAAPNFDMSRFRKMEISSQFDHA